MIFQQLLIICDSAGIPQDVWLLLIYLKYTYFMKQGKKDTTKKKTFSGRYFSQDRDKNLKTKAKVAKSC